MAEDWGPEHVRAAVAGVSGAELVDSDGGEQLEGGNVVCFVVKPLRKPIAVITREGCKISIPSLAKAVNVSKAKLSMASAADCVALFGFSPGRIPPLGLRPEVSVYLSSEITRAGGRLGFSSGAPNQRLLLDAEALTTHYSDVQWLMDEERVLVGLGDQLRACQQGRQPLRFVCDSMLNRLAHKLRALDLDVVIVGEQPGDVARLRPLPPASRPVRPTHPQRRREEEQLCDLIGEGRIGLTSSGSTLAALHGFVYLLQTATVEEQTREVCAVFGVHVERRMKTLLDRRCCMCNGPLKQVDKATAASKVPVATLEAYDDYFSCDSEGCGHIFWHGSTFRESVKDTTRILEDLVFDACDADHQ